MKNYVFWHEVEQRHYYTHAWSKKQARSNLLYRKEDPIKVYTSQLNKDRYEHHIKEVK